MGLAWLRGKRSKQEKWVSVLTVHHSRRAADHYDYDCHVSSELKGLHNGAVWDCKDSRNILTLIICFFLFRKNRDSP